MNRTSIFSDLMEGVLEEKFISFHIRRNPSNHLPGPRKVLVQNTFPKQMIFPGVKNNETDLIADLRQYQNWHDAEKYSIKIGPLLHSFLWRLRDNRNAFPARPRLQKKVDEKDVVRMKKNYKSYQAALRSSLTPGQVYLVPDSEITFNDPGRVPKPYARKILVFETRPGMVRIIPFTGTIIKKYIIPETDILFDPDRKTCNRLDHGSRPAIENFPYKIFTKPVLLCASKSQPMVDEEFLSMALLPVGAVQKDVLTFIREKFENYPRFSV